MPDQKQIEQVCKALGIEKKSRIELIRGREEPSIPTYPTGPDLLAAVKGKLRILYPETIENLFIEWKIYREVEVCWTVEIFLTKRPRGYFMGESATELDALLSACEQAFCSKVAS